MNYTDLQSNVTDWFARTDLPDKVFISLAEDELNRVLRVQAMENITTVNPTTLTIDGLYSSPFPTDYLQLRHIERGGHRLEYLSPNQMNEDVGNAYTIANSLFLFSGQEDVDIYYYKKIPVLTDSNLTNWFTDNAYDVLLYLMLDHGSGYTGEPSDYRQKAIKRIAVIQAMDDRARYSGAPLVQRG